VHETVTVVSGTNCGYVSAWQTVFIGGQTFTAKPLLISFENQPAGTPFVVTYNYPDLTLSDIPLIGSVAEVVLSTPKKIC